MGKNVHSKLISFDDDVNIPIFHGDNIEDEACAVIFRSHLQA